MFAQKYRPSQVLQCIFIKKSTVVGPNKIQQKNCSSNRVQHVVVFKDEQQRNGKWICFHSAPLSVQPNKPADHDFLIRRLNEKFLSAPYNHKILCVRNIINREIACYTYKILSIRFDPINKMTFNFHQNNTELRKF